MAVKKKTAKKAVKRRVPRQKSVVERRELTAMYVVSVSYTHDKCKTPHVWVQRVISESELQAKMEVHRAMVMEGCAPTDYAVVRLEAILDFPRPMIRRTESCR